MMRDVTDMLGAEARSAKEDMRDVFLKAFKVFLNIIKKNSKKNIILSSKNRQEPDPKQTGSASKAPKMKKPKGMAREVYNLIAKDDGSTDHEHMPSAVATPLVVSNKYRLVDFIFILL